MKTIVACCMLAVAVCAWGDDQAAVTFSGKGKGGIEVRDAAGKVEVVDPAKLRLNQIPADAAAREKAYREKTAADAAAIAARRAEEEAAAQTAAEEAAAAEAAAQAEASAAAEQAAQLEEQQHPSKVRRATVRGTRYLENPPPPKPAPASTEPVMSMSGKKKTAPADAETTPTPADADKPAPDANPADSDPQGT